MDGVEAFAFEHSEVTFVHVIQRCERIETQLFELLGDCVSIRRDALDWEILEPCFDERQFLDNFVGSALRRAGDAAIGGP